MENIQNCIIMNKANVEGFVFEESFEKGKFILVKYTNQKGKKIHYSQEIVSCEYEEFKFLDEKGKIEKLRALAQTENFMIRRSLYKKIFE